ncbi:NmrA/HSCARG family protein [Nocardiopsis flavescens]
MPTENTDATDESRTAATGTVVVLGATGQQGGSVAAALRADGWNVRALVRDPAGSRARSLAAAGIETVPGDLGDPGSLRAAFSGAQGVFSVQPNAGQAGAVVSNEDEVRFGTTVADIAGESGVAHLVYSSAGVVGATPTGVAHLDTKMRVESHIRGLGIAATVLRPATFMELLVAPDTGLDRGRMSFLMGPDQSHQVIAVRDIGRVAAAVFGAPERYVGRTLEIAGDALTGEDMARHLARAAGRPIRYSRLPEALLARDETLGRLAELAGGRLAGSADLDALRAEFPFLLSFDRWLAGPGAGLLEEALRPGGAGGHR